MSGYDAGSVTASLSIDTAKAKADLDKISAEVKKLEDTPHKIKITAVFDQSAMSKARSMFRDLDNAISRDAMQRLRSSPQGSVLGALNALFSPHPVTGAPSPQQAAQSGLLGKMIGDQGGGGPVTGGTSGGSSSQGNTQSTNDIRDVLTGQQPKDTSTTNTIRDVTEGQQPGNVKTEDLITPKVTGSLPGDVKTTDTVKVVTQGDLPKDADTTDTVHVKVTGAESLPKDTSTTDTVHEKLDQGDAAKLAADSGAAGDRSGASFSSMFTSHVRSVLTSVAGLFGGGGGGGSIGDAAGKSGGGAGDSFAKGFGAHLIAGIGPVILGIPAKMALLVPAVGTALAALPALAGVIGTGMGVAMIGGLIAVVAKNSPALKAQLTGIGADAKKMLTTIGAPIIPALTKAFAQIPALLKSITGPLTDVMKTVAPQIAGVFAGLTPIIRGLVGIMQAAAPAFGPVIEGIEKLVANILPGIQVVIKAMVPFLSQFAGILATLGSHLGQFFSAAAPAIGASMKVLGALLDVVGALLPIIVKLGGVFATALAPAIASFAAVIKSMTPFLTIVGTILSKLAGAVLGDLVSAFTALATLFTDIAPALASFASSLGVVFTTLENSGVFAILGDALESLAAPLAALISALLTGLAPILPPLFTAIGQIAAILAGGLAAAVLAVLPPLTTLATDVLAAIAKLLPTVIPLLTDLAKIFTGALVGVIKGVAVALDAIIKAIPPGVIEAMVTGFYAYRAAVLAMAATQAVVGALNAIRAAMFGVDASMDANPIGLVVIAIAALGVAFYEAWEKSAGFRNIMKDIASDFLQFGIIVVEENKLIIGAVLDMFSAIINGAADAFGWVPGLGGALRTAAKGFDDFKNSVNNGFNSTIATMQGWQADLSGALSTAHDKIGTVSQDFANQGKAAAAAKAQLDTYTTAVQQNGASSDAARAARQQLITDLTSAGVNATTANTDVTNYSNAIAQNGATSTQAQAARQQLITDILGASTNATQGVTDLNSYTSAVQNNGAQSAAAQAARAQLITDLENAGVSAKTATSLVDGLGSAVNGLPKSANIAITMKGDGTYSITQTATGAAGSGGQQIGHGGAPAKAAGGYIGTGTGPTADDVPIMASKGEYVVQASSVAKYGTPMMDAINAGKYASGGPVGSGNLTPAYINGMYADFKAQFQAAMIAAMQGSIKAAAAAAQAAAGAVGGVAGANTKTAAGDYTLAQLEALWIKAGGNPAAAYNMALIAIAESGGNPNSYNPSGATGLWQIEYPGSQVVAGNLYNPSVNAANAVALYNSRGYEPWEADPVGARLTGYGPAPHGAKGMLVGYGQGGLINEPITGVGVSGQMYKFGEAGPEYVIPGNKATGVPGASGSRVEALLEQLIAVTGSLPHGITGGIGNALSGAAQSASLRTRYPRGGA